MAAKYTPRMNWVIVCSFSTMANGYFNYGVTGTSPCESGADDHGYNNDEYQTSAATEGFARFFPAAGIQ
jgi:hypothetical protein